MSVTTLLVTGTDTGVGKTVASCVLLEALRARGLRAVGMKPVASGSALTAHGWRNDDALALLAHSSDAPRYDDVNPYALPEPTAPEIAAAHAGRSVSLARLVECHARLAAGADVVVVEGVGGWLAPLAPAIDHADLARALDASVVLVVGLRLGCINHARLTERAIRADGFAPAGWIANRIDPAMDFADETLDLLAGRLSTPRLGVLPHGDDPHVMAAALDLRRCEVALPNPSC